MPNDVINTRSGRFHAPNTTIQSQSSQVRRPPTPPAQPRPVSRNRQDSRVPNRSNNSLPFRRTKSTKSTGGIKKAKSNQLHGRKRKTKVNVAKRSKRASQKKRSRKMSRRQRGGRQIINNPDKYKPTITELEEFKTLLFDFYPHWLKISIKEILEIFNLKKQDSFPFIIKNKKFYLEDLSTRMGKKNPNVDFGMLADLLYYLAFNEKMPCEYFRRKITNIYDKYTKIGKGLKGPSTDVMTAKIITYIERLKNGTHENHPDAKITCDTQEYKK